MMSPTTQSNSHFLIRRFARFLLDEPAFHENNQATENTIEQLFHDLDKDKNTQLARPE